MKIVITEDELTSLIQMNRSDMYYLALSMLSNPVEAQDVVGETIMRAFERRHQLRKKESSRAWLMQIEQEQKETGRNDGKGWVFV